MTKLKLADGDFQRKEPGLQGKFDIGIPQNERNFSEMRRILDSTGPGFCLAKWTQLTLHLGNGTGHSCHHPTPHKIPLDEIKRDPAALHNTLLKKQHRRNMLNGGRPKECDYCWRVEDDPNNNFHSDRIQKSCAKFSIGDHDAISEMTGYENVYPRYLEVDFGRVCNFKCTYCGPDYSSIWSEEIKQHGHYKLPFKELYYGYNETDNAHILQREDNPYTDAFWEWFPEAKKHLDTLRITGGEPLLSKHTFKVLEMLCENPEPELELSINSNANPPEKLWNRMIELVNDLTQNNKIKKFTLYTSCEAYSGQAEYIRWGLDFELMQQNVEQFLEQTHGTRVVFMTAFNVLSIPSFTDFLKYVLSLKKRFNYNGFMHWLENDMGINVQEELIQPSQPELYKDAPMSSFADRKENTKGKIFGRVGIDIPFVRYPDFLDAQLATRDLCIMMMKSADFMFSNLNSANWYDCLGFEEWECEKLNRIFRPILFETNKFETEDGTTSDELISKKRARFFLYTQEYDKRRNTSLLLNFPEMENFLNTCEKEWNKWKSHEGEKWKH